MKALVRAINILTIIVFIGFIPLTLRQYLNIKSRKPLSKDQILAELTVVRPPERKKDHSLILKKNPFGLKGQVSVNRPQQKEEKTLSLEGYKLLGTVSDGKGRGYAFIQDPSGKVDFYQNGKKIEGLGLLKGVWPEYALVGTPPQRLNLVDIPEVEDLKPSPVSSPKAHLRPRTRRSGPSDLERFIRKRGDNEFVIDRQKVEEAIENPEQLMTDARLQPAFKNGKQYGFVLRNVKPNGIYSKLGLRNGDVLLKINEFDITDPETALRAFNELRGADEIELHIQRAGKEQTLKYYIE